MPHSAAGLVILLGFILMVVSTQDPAYSRRTSAKHELPGCHQIVWTDLDDDTRTLHWVCVPQQDYDAAQVAHRYIGPT